MPQHKQLTWSELRVGIFVLAGILVIVVGVFYVTGAGFWGPKYRLVTYLPEVNGLASGSPVTLDGVQIGNVETIRMAPVKSGTYAAEDRSVEVVMRLSRSFQDYIRSDSKASLITQGFVGDRNITITRGYTGMILKEGQEVPAESEQSIQAFVASGTDLMQNIKNLSTQITSLVGDIRQGKGTIGKLVEDDTLYTHLNGTVNRLDQISSSIQQGQGSLGKLVSSDELYSKIDSVAGRTDNILAAVEDQKGSLGKLIYDPSIHDSARSFLASGNSLLSDIHDGKGTLGKLATDDSLYTSTHQTIDNLREATAKLNSGSNTVGKLFTDPKLYDNLTSLTGDMRLLIGDFRANPKKFLRIKLSLF